MKDIREGTQRGELQEKLSKTTPSTGEPLEIGGANERVAVRLGVGRIVLIGHDEENVGPLVGQRSCSFPDTMVSSAAADAAARPPLAVEYAGPGWYCQGRLLRIGLRSCPWRCRQCAWRRGRCVLIVFALYYVLC